MLNMFDSGLMNVQDEWINGTCFGWMKEDAWMDGQVAWKNCRYTCKMAGLMDAWLDSRNSTCSG